MNNNNDWFTVKQISSRVYEINDRGESSIYLVIGSEKALLIDTGWGVGDLPKLVSNLTELPLIVVNTHGHSDHVGGGYMFPEIHISEAEVMNLKGCFTAENRRWILGNILKGPFPATFHAEKWINEKIDKVTFIKNGHIFDLGDKKVEVIAFPGHSRGGIGLLDQQEKLFFSGDTILEGDIWMHLDHSTSLEKFLESLHVIDARSHEIEKILPAHARTPLEYKIVHELIAGIEGILSGKRKGVPHKTFAGDGVLYRFDTCGIVYKNLI